MLGELGSGGFAKVYKVRHGQLGYIRAIRVLNEPVVDENSRTYQKFLRECKVLLRLGNGSHRNIVHIYQPRLLDSHALVEMDYVDGKDLSHYLTDNGNFVPLQDILRMVEELSSALSYCHEDIYRFCMDRDADNLQDDPNDGSKVLIDEAKRKELIDKYKVIHNDIHSGNIMRREDGSYVLLDFGLAITGGDDVRNSSRHDGGAVEFKPPEKWDDDSVLSEQSDIYSFGVVMYEYLAGRVPFPFDKSISNKSKALYLLGVAHKSENPPSIYELRKSYFEANNPSAKYEKDYPEWLESAILKCLEKNPEDRFSNGRELYDYVRAHIDEDRLSAGLNKKLEKEKDDLKGENDRLVKQVAKIAIKNNELDDRIKTLSGELSSSMDSIRKLESEKKELKDKNKGLQDDNDDIKKQTAELKADLDRLKNEQGNSGSSKWKVFCIILAFLLIGGGIWYYIGDNTMNQSDELENKNYVIDSLQQANGLLQYGVDSLQTIIHNFSDTQNAANDEIKSLTKAYTDLKDKYEELESISTYNGHDAKYWYDNRLFKERDAEYWFKQYQNKNSSGMYKGHNAEYWYNNRLFKEKSAEEWYNKYMEYK